jgi:hypothetical protein
MQLLNRPKPPSDLEDLLDLLKKILDLLTSAYPAGEFRLVAPCEEGKIDVAKWKGGIGTINEVVAMVKALAEMMQFQKDQKQPICHTRAIGSPVVVDFVQIDEPVGGEAPLRKTLSYRDLGQVDLARHTAAWEKFQWEAGPVQLIGQGKWGKVQVYAATREEGERVIRWAASLARCPIDGDKDWQWIEGQHTGGRIGRPGIMAVRQLRDGIAVRYREGASGKSYYLGGNSREGE